MSRSSDIADRVHSGLIETLAVRDGRVVPEASDLAMNAGVELEATYVYADMAGSSRLAHAVLRDVAAKVIRAYVNTATQLLGYWGGEIRSFDGDRVMAIFIGDDRNRQAAKAAMEINWATSQVIWPEIQARWSDTASWGWTLGHGVGIDTGTALLIRTGVRGDNDLVSVGTAPNVAAKLSELRGAGQIHITDVVYQDLNDNLWYGPKGERMWSPLLNRVNVGGASYLVHSTNWHWGPT